MGADPRPSPFTSAASAASAVPLLPRAESPQPRAHSREPTAESLPFAERPPQSPASGAVRPGTGNSAVRCFVRKPSLPASQPRASSMIS